MASARGHVATTARTAASRPPGTRDDTATRATRFAARSATLAESSGSARRRAPGWPRAGSALAKPVQPGDKIADQGRLGGIVVEGQDFLLGQMNHAAGAQPGFQIIGQLIGGLAVSRHHQTRCFLIAEP